MSKAKRAQVILLLESAVLMIALVMPVTPSKTGGNTRVAKYFIDQPTYFHEVVVNVVLIHLIVAVLVLVALAINYYQSRRAGGD